MCQSEIVMHKRDTDNNMQISFKRKKGNLKITFPKNLSDSGYSQTIIMSLSNKTVKSNSAEEFKPLISTSF